MSQEDLSRFFREWPHEPGRINARRIDGADERSKIQVRIELGVLQMEMEGRPDGLRPDGYTSLLESKLDQLQRYVAQSQMSSGFVLSHDECRAMREEAMQFYHRYVALFAIGEYAGVVRDTTHNLQIFELCRDYGESESDRTLLEQFRPHVVAMRSRAEAELALAASEPKQALAAINRGLDDIRAWYADHGRADEYSESNDVVLLQGMRDALVPRLPASQRAELEERLRSALDAENYELAAILRDELRLLE